MKEYFNVPQDLYVFKPVIKLMEEGQYGLGYIAIPSWARPQEFELVPKESFQPISNHHVINEKMFNVVFIGK